MRDIDYEELGIALRKAIDEKVSSLFEVNVSDIGEFQEDLNIELQFGDYYFDFEANVYQGGVIVYEGDGWNEQFTTSIEIAEEPFVEPMSVVISLGVLGEDENLFIGTDFSKDEDVSEELTELYEYFKYFSYD